MTNNSSFFGDTTSSPIANAFLQPEVPEEQSVCSDEEFILPDNKQDLLRSGRIILKLEPDDIECDTPLETLITHLEGEQRSVEDPSAGRNHTETQIVDLEKVIPVKCEPVEGSSYVNTKIAFRNVTQPKELNCIDSQQPNEVNTKNGFSYVAHPISLACLNNDCQPPQSVTFEELDVTDWELKFSIGKPERRSLYADIFPKTYSDHYNKMICKDVFFSANIKPEFYRCQICRERFLTASEYESHCFMHTSVQALMGKETHEPNQCTVCGERFAKASEYTSHSFMHTANMPDPRMPISKISKYDISLVNSEETLMGKAKYELQQCAICGEKFATSSEYTSHSLMHTSQVPASMENNSATRKMTQEHAATDNMQTDLSKGDASKQNLNRIRVIESKYHEAKILFRCGICDQLFTSDVELKRHVSDHKEKSDFSCSVCGKSFIYLVNLKQHKIFHENNPFPCYVCNMGFKNRIKLKLHLMRHKT